MTFNEAPDKLTAVNRISRLTNSGPQELGPGSKERKSLFVNLARALDLETGSSISKQQLARNIATKFGVEWTPDCESEGMTITLRGLNLLLEAGTKWFEVHPILSVAFPYQVGDKFKRSDLHGFVGGSFRTGMTSCLNGAEFLLFHDKLAGREFGYDKWDGLQADGTFSYTGQGFDGSQEMKLGNLGLMRASQEGKPIRLIESIEGSCVYLGQFILGSPPYRTEKAPDINSTEREVFVFNLVPVASLADLSGISGEVGVKGIEKDWQSPNLELIFRAATEYSQIQISQFEHQLQSDFGEYLRRNSIDFKNYEFTFSDTKGRLKPDFWINSLKLVVEAKVSSSRDFVRQGIGQVLDYANLSALEGTNYRPGLLLPNPPSNDLMRLISSLGIVLIHPDGDDFTFISNAERL